MLHFTLWRGEILSCFGEQLQIRSERCKGVSGVGRSVFFHLDLCTSISTTYWLQCLFRKLIYRHVSYVQNWASTQSLLPNLTHSCSEGKNSVFFKVFRLLFTIVFSLRLEERLTS